MQFETIVVIFGNVQFGESFGCRQFFEAIPIIGMRAGNTLARETCELDCELLSVAFIFCEHELAAQLPDHSAQSEPSLNELAGLDVSSDNQAHKLRNLLFFGVDGRNQQAFGCRAHCLVEHA